MTLISLRMKSTKKKKIEKFLVYAYQKLFSFFVYNFLTDDERQLKLSKGLRIMTLTTYVMVKVIEGASLKVNNYPIFVRILNIKML